MDSILKAFDLERKDLDFKCPRKIRDRIASEIVDEWYLIGRELDVYDKKLKSILQDNITLTSPEDKAVAVLDVWGEERGVAATCLKLAEALYNRRKMRVLEILCEEVKRLTEDDKTTRAAQLREELMKEEAKATATDGPVSEVTKINIEPKRKADDTARAIERVVIVKSGQIVDPDRLFNNVAMDISSKYKEVGIELGLTYTLLNNELDTGAFMMFSASKKAMKMLQLWKDSVAEEDLTYSKLAAALEKNGLKRCADKYCYTTAIESSSVPESDDAVSLLDDALHKELKMKDHFIIASYLKDLPVEQLKQLGLVLGLYYPRLKRMESFPDDIVHSWLLQQDGVIEMSGRPTFETLATALEEIGKKGLAYDVRHAKRKSTMSSPSGHILTKEELSILRRLLADYSDEKLTEIRRRFEENQGGDIFREDVEKALREKGLTEIADDLKKSIEEGVENQKHYEAYESALRGGLSLIMRYLKIVLFGPPRSGKSSTLRRLLKEIENLKEAGELSESTGVADTNEVIIDIKELTSKVTAISSSQWRSLNGSKEGDFHDLTKLFYELILNKSVDIEATDDAETKDSQNPSPQNKPQTTPQNQPELPHHVSTNLSAELNAEVSSVTLSDAEEMEIDKAFKKLTAVLQNDSPDYVKQLLESLTLANMIDVGGQSAFLDVLPTLTTGPALYMLFFRLDQDLTEVHTEHFRPAGSKDEIKLDGSYRIDEVMCQALSSIVCFSRQPSKESDESASQASAESASTYAIIFGTFKDKATAAEISEKERTIQDKLMKTKLLLKTRQRKPFFTVDNRLGTDKSEMAEIRTNIESIITKKFSTLPIPASWLMFRMLLRLFGKSVVSLAQCEEIASRLSMTTPVREAIWFFHHNIGSLMHYPDIPSMKEVVICNPQVIFDSISKLIIDKLWCNDYIVDQSAIDDFHQKGQFTLSDIDDKTKDQRSDLLSPKQLVDLLKDRNVVAEIKEADTDQGAVPSEPKYIMPSVLKYATEEQLKLQTSEQEASPLLIHFESGFVPFGVFCASVANLIARQNSLSPRWQLCDDRVMKNKVKFCIDKSFDTTLISRPQYLEIRVERDVNNKYSLSDICSTVRQTVVQTLETVISHMKYKPYALVLPTDRPFDIAFTCCREESHYDHLMKVDKDKSEYCGECLKVKKRVVLKNEHLVWFGQNKRSTCETLHPKNIPVPDSSALRNTPSSLDQQASTHTQQHTTDESTKRPVKRERVCTNEYEETPRKIQRIMKTGPIAAPQNTATSLDQPASTLTQQHTTDGDVGAVKRERESGEETDRKKLKVMNKYGFERDDLICPSSIYNRIAGEIVSDWNMIGRLLGVSTKALTTIRQDRSLNSPEEQAAAMLDTWVEEKGRDATCLKLAEILDERKHISTLGKFCKLVKEYT